MKGHEWTQEQAKSAQSPNYRKLHRTFENIVSSITDAGCKVTRALDPAPDPVLS